MSLSCCDPRPGEQKILSDRWQRTVRTHRGPRQVASMGATMTTDCGSFRDVSCPLDQVAANRGITREASRFAVKCEHFVSMILVRWPVFLSQPLNHFSGDALWNRAGGARTHDREIVWRENPASFRVV